MDDAKYIPTTKTMRSTPLNDYHFLIVLVVWDGKGEDPGTNLRIPLNVPRVRVLRKNTRRIIGREEGNVQSTNSFRTEKR